MNMIVNSSDLVGYEAETKIETKKVASKTQTLGKLLKAWEKKQMSASKKAAGFGFLAVSLAACNSDDNTPYSEADKTAFEAAATTAATTAALTGADGVTYATLDAAITSNDATITAAATTAALTAADGTIYTTVDAAKTAGINTSSADAIAAAETAALTGTDGTVHATVDAAVTSNDATITAAATSAAEATLMAGVSGFDTVAALSAAYTTATSSTSASYTMLTTQDTYTGGTGTDTITGTSATVGATDIIVGGEGTDTITIAATGALTAPNLITGVENVNVSLTSFAGAALDVDNIIAYTTMTFTNLQTGGTTALNADNVEAGGTVVVGAGITGTANIDADGAVTIDGGAATSLDIDLNNVTTGSTITANSVTGGTAITDGAGDIEVNNADDVTISSTSAAFIILDGDTDTTDAASISAANASATATIGLETGLAQQVELLTLSGNGGAATYVLGADDAPESITLTGDQNVMVSGTASQLSAEPVLDTTGSGASATVRVNTAAASLDLGSVATSVIIDVNSTNAIAMAIDLAQNATVTKTSDVGGHLTLASDATTSNIGEILNLTLAATEGTQNIIVSDFETVNLTVDDGLTANNTITIADLQGTAATGGVINISGTGDHLTLTGANATAINAAGFAGTLTATVAADLLTITGGSGNDTINLADQNATLDGGDGTDTLNVDASLNLDNNTFSMSSFEVVAIDPSGDGSDTFTVDSSDATGKSWIVTGVGTNDVMDLTMDGAVVDLSNMTIDATDVSVTIDAAASNQLTLTIDGSNAVDTLANAGSGNITINTYAGNDVIPTAGGADVIDGGAGDDNIDQGAGNDTVTGGEGADNINTSTGSDTINLAETTAAVDTLVVTAQGTDVITVNGFDFGGTTTDDNITLDITDVEAYTAVTDLVDGAGTSLSGTPAIVLLAVTAAATDIGAAANNIITLTGDYATGAILETAIETGGSLNLTFGAFGSAGDAVVVIYDDGVNSKIATVTTANAISDGAKAAAGDLTVTDHIILNGVADATSILAGDFTAWT